MKNSNEIKKTLGFSNIEKVLKNNSTLGDKNGTYKGIKELKKDLEENDKLKKEFESVKNQEEAIKVAQKLGYKISEEEIESDEELAESMLESVAGGRAKVKIKSYSFKSDTIADGNNANVQTNVKWRAEGEK